MHENRNFFMPAPVKNCGKIECLRPRSSAGDYVELGAEVDCIMVFSACPDDVYPTNGETDIDDVFQSFDAETDLWVSVYSAF